MTDSAKPASNFQIPSASPRVLVVDDEPSVLETIAAILSREGYAVATAETASHALEHLRSDRFDVVLTDLRLAGGNGISLLAEIRRNWPETMTIMLTGYASLQSAIDALREGVYDYLTKPCDVEDLKATVARAIDRVSLTRALHARLEELDAANAKLQGFNQELSLRVDQATADLKRKIDELAEAKRQLEKARRQREEFNAIIVHELRQPLTALAGYAQFLARPGLSPSTKERARQTIVSETGRLIRLVQDLADASHLATGRFEIHPTTCDLADIVRKQVELARDSSERHAITCDVPDHVPAVADRDRIAQLLSNLLTNAIKYTLGGTIRVGLRVEREQASLTVEDEGPGIPAEQREAVFVPGVRLASDDGGESNGTGLGLFIAKGIVEAHGGRIWVDSGASSQGAVFSVSLPLTPTPDS